MADAAGLRRLVTEYGRTVHDKAAESLVNQLSAATPRYTGALERARRRTDSFDGTVYSALIEQPAGDDEPSALPDWLDEGTEFLIEAVNAKALRFRGTGGQVVFRRSVWWKPKPGSVGFWSRTVTADAWRDAIDRASSTTSVGPS